MRAQPIAAAASEHERHALEAHFQPPFASSTTSPPAASPGAPTSAGFNWRRTTHQPPATLIRAAAEPPRSASRDAASRRQYRFGGAGAGGAAAPPPPPPLSPIFSTSTPHTGGRSNHPSCPASTPSQALTHRTGIHRTDWSDSETDAAHQEGSPLGSFTHQ